MVRTIKRKDGLSVVIQIAAPARGDYAGFEPRFEIVMRSERFPVHTQSDAVDARNWLTARGIEAAAATALIDDAFNEF